MVVRFVVDKQIVCTIFLVKVWDQKDSIKEDKIKGIAIHLNTNNISGFTHHAVLFCELQSDVKEHFINLSVKWDLLLLRSASKLIKI